MKIEIKVVEENEDGSADIEVFMDEEAKDLLIRRAIVAAITEAAQDAIDNYVPENKNES